MKPLLMIALLCLALVLSPVAARPDRGDQGAEGGAGSGISAGQAAEAARRQTGGRVLAVKPSGGGYQVRVLTADGAVKQIFVPGGRR